MKLDFSFYFIFCQPFLCLIELLFDFAYLTLEVRGEDLLPALLEEFPHLQLSMETWHELWRKSIVQLEYLTRSYRNSRRKRDQTQQQVCIFYCIKHWFCAISIFSSILSQFIGYSTNISGHLPQKYIYTSLKT